MTDYKETPLFKTLKEMMREMMQELKQELRIEMKMMMDELKQEIKPQQNTRHYNREEEDKKRREMDWMAIKEAEKIKEWMKKQKVKI